MKNIFRSSRLLLAALLMAVATSASATVISDVTYTGSYMGKELVLIVNATDATINGNKTLGDLVGLSFNPAGTSTITNFIGDGFVFDANGDSKCSSGQFCYTSLNGASLANPLVFKLTFSDVTDFNKLAFTATYEALKKNEKPEFMHDKAKFTFTDANPVLNPPIGGGPTGPTNDVPEPATYALMLIGLGMLTVASKRKPVTV